MNALFAFARAVDWLTDRFGAIAKWAVFLSCFISAGNAVVRYALDISSNAFLEVQWYMFAACVMLGAAQVLRLNEHVRVDVLYGRYNGKTQVLIDLFGLLFFLLPVIGGTLFGWLSYVLKNLHNFAGPVFAVSLVVVFITFVRDIVPMMEDLRSSVEATAEKLPKASSQLDKVSTATEMATTEILNIVEGMMAKVDRIRSETDGDHTRLESIQDDCTNIMIALQVQDITAQQIAWFKAGSALNALN